MNAVATPPALKILVVDDEPDLEPLIRQGFRHEVRAGQYSFAFARDGQQALDAIEKDLSIDLVLTDIYMPNLDGLSLLESIGELDRVLRAVVVTAYGDMQNIRTAMNRGAFDFLTKPLYMDDLKATVRKASEAIQQQKRAALVRKTFGRYLSDEVVATLLEDESAPELGGEKRRVTLLMSDLRGFSTIAEELVPEEVLEVLNIYLGRMADVIARYGGTIVDFIGDAILIVFGAPFQRADDASRAVACALEMQCAMAEVNADVRRLGLRGLEMGIGIHTGDVIVGNVGSRRRMKYGAVGSHVNLTARVESFTVGGQVLTTEATLDEADVTVLLGKEIRLSAKGFSAPVRVYEVEGVGPPYDIALPVYSGLLVELGSPWSCECEVLDGKYMTGDTFRGDILRLSASGAIVRTDVSVSPLSNVRLTTSPRSGEIPEIGELYAKVVEADAQQDLLHLRFTAVPRETHEAILRVCESHEGETMQ